MQVLVTNDDGWNSVGIGVLRAALRSAGHTVALVAPDRPRSACSHAITPFKPIALTEYSPLCYVSSGTPSDCVFLGLCGELQFKPDVVVSGINHGANLGRDVVYSGTVGAARQAVLMGVPGIAVSLCVEEFTRPSASEFHAVAKMVSQQLEQLCDGWSPDHLININAPHKKWSGTVALTTLSQRKYAEHYTTFSAHESSTTYYLMSGSPLDTPEDPTSDINAILKGHMSLSPIMAYYDTLSPNSRYHAICSAASRQIVESTLQQ